MMVRFPWPKDGKAESTPLDLQTKMIEFNMEDKRGMTKFWR
ncbi:MULTISPECIES: hypothetical protein [Corynebacterium]|nr:MULTISPECIES: hypothetical protein [Corynebacterium]MDK8819737.1 hypothetical protein [Corynebacterium amycolatum]